MTQHRRDFATEEAALRAQLDAKDPLALFGLRALEEKWARSLVNAKTSGPTLSTLRSAVATGVDKNIAERCADHLKQAAAWQREIASFATSGAEGSAAISEARGLELAQALVLGASKDSASRSRALQLCRSLERVGDGLNATLRKELQRVKRELE